jgi:hypothetical protein
LLPHCQLPPSPRPAAKNLSLRTKLLIPLLLLLSLAGCSRLKPKQENETVYVLAKQTFLRDRVAAVSNRVAVVQNGDRLELLERGRRFLKVKTSKGEIGWIEEHAVVNPDVVTGFEQLQKGHKADPVVATAVLRDDGYLHLKPGRDTDRYYLLPEGDKLQMLVRASVPKMVGPQASGTASSYAAKPSANARKKSTAKNKPGTDKPDDKKPATPVAGPSPAPPPAAAAPGTPSSPISTTQPGEPVPMEDWWLVRDSQGKVGWLMSRRIDVDVPDDIAGYAEGQRMVAAYVLQKVYDPGSNFADKQATEYVTVLNTYQDGLPYDFNQVRVFTWNLKRHRYETAFRQRNLQGYLPVVVSFQTLEKGEAEPTFQFKQGIGDSVTIDPDTSAAKPTSTETLNYRLEGSLVKKFDPNAPVASPRPASAPVPAASKPTKSAKRAGRPKHHHHQ